MSLSLFYYYKDNDFNWLMVIGLSSPKKVTKNKRAWVKKNQIK